MPFALLRRIRSPDWIPILVGQGVGVACGLVGIRLISTLVPPEIFGFYGLCLALVPAGMLLTHHGLARHVARHWAAKTAASTYYLDLLAAARQASLVLVGLLALALALLSTWSPGVAFAPNLPWLSAAALAGAYAALLHAALQTTRAYWADCALSCAHSVTRTGGPLLAVVAAGATVPVLLAGFALPQVLVLVTGWWLVVGRKPRTLPDPSSAGVRTNTPDTFTGYGRAFWLVGACTLIAGGLHRWLAAGCLPAEELGYFTLAGNLAFVAPNVLSAAISQFLYPRLFARARREAGSSPSTWLRPVELAAAGFALAAVTCTLLLHALGPWLAGWLIADTYRGALPYLIANGAYGTALALGHFYQLPALAAERPAAAGRAMLGLTLVLGAGGWAASRFSSGAFTSWLTATPLVAMAVLATMARLERKT